MKFKVEEDDLDIEIAEFNEKIPLNSHMTSKLNYMFYKLQEITDSIKKFSEINIKEDLSYINEDEKYSDEIKEHARLNRRSLYRYIKYQFSCLETLEKEYEHLKQECKP